MKRTAVAALISLTACGSRAASSITTTSAATTIAAATATAAPTTTMASAVTRQAPTTTAPSTTAPPTTASGQTIAGLLALGRPIVLAHTGGEDQFPASTMFAFGESMKAGVDVLDLNVQLTRDGVLVVHHDDSVDGATEGTGKLADLTFAQIHALDDAYRFTADCVCKDKPEGDYLYRGIRTGQRPPPPGYTAEDFAVPTLRTLITRYPDVPLNIEIKGSGDPAVAAAKQLAAELTELDRLDATVVASFDDAVVDAFHTIAPTVEVSPGLSASTAWVLQGTPLPDGERILQLPPEFNGLQVLTPDVVKRAHAAGYAIWVWPNDRAWENAGGYARLLRMGMDGLNINFPATGVAAVAAFHGLAVTR